MYLPANIENNIDSECFISTQNKKTVGNKKKRSIVIKECLENLTLTRRIESKRKTHFRRMSKGVYEVVSHVVVKERQKRGSRKEL